MESLVEAVTQLGFSSLLTSLFASLFIVWYVRTYWAPIANNLPPGPQRKPFPFNILAGIFKGNIIHYVMNLTKKYGEIVYLHEGDRRIVLIAAPDLVRDLIVKQADVTSARQTVPVIQRVFNYDKGGIIFSRGDVWTDHRRFGLAALRNFGMGKKSLQYRINEEAQMLCLEMDSKNSKPLNMADVINNAVSNIICSITFGNRFEYSDPNFQLIIARLNKFANSDIGFLGDLPAILSRPQEQNLSKIRDFISQKVKEHMETFDENDVRDIIDMYLAEVRRSKAAGEKTHLQEDQMLISVWDLFVAGTETTSSTLLWCILLLAGYPEIQTRIFEEIHSVVGSGRKPTYDDRKSMPYTQAFLTETLRFRPIAPFGVPHLAEADLTIRGYWIPKGTDITINIIAIHHDPSIWGDPEVFKPERFLSPDEKTVVKHPAFMPFGAGRRVCLGEQLAKMELFLFFTNLVQRFSFKLPEGVKADYGFGHRIGTLLPRPYKVMAVNR